MTRFVKRYLPPVAFERVRERLSDYHDPLMGAWSRLPIEEGRTFIYVPEWMSEEETLRFGVDVPYIGRVTAEEEDEDHRMLVKNVEEYVLQGGRRVSVTITGYEPGVLYSHWNSPVWNTYKMNNFNMAYYFLDRERASEPERARDILFSSCTGVYTGLTTLPTDTLPAPESEVSAEFLEAVGLSTQVLAVTAYSDGGLLYWEAPR